MIDDYTGSLLVSYDENTCTLELTEVGQFYLWDSESYHQLTGFGSWAVVCGLFQEHICPGAWHWIEGKWIGRPELGDEGIIIGINIKQRKDYSDYIDDGLIYYYAGEEDPLEVLRITNQLVLKRIEVKK